MKYDIIHCLHHIITIFEVQNNVIIDMKGCTNGKFLIIVYIWLMVAELKSDKIPIEMPSSSNK